VFLVLVGPQLFREEVLEVLGEDPEEGRRAVGRDGIPVLEAMNPEPGDSGESRRRGETVRSSSTPVIFVYVWWMTLWVIFHM
jgi:hypothetical protein